MGKTLFDKVWDSHVIERIEDGPDVLFIDKHFIHEVTSPVAFVGLKNRNLKVMYPHRTFATADHNTPTINQHLPIKDRLSAMQVKTLEKNCNEHGIDFWGLGHKKNGIVHVIGPENGITQPGLTIVCGDSHTSTHGAFGAIAFGIGTSEVEMVLACQTIMQQKPMKMKINVDGKLSPNVTPKDVAIYIISKLSSSGATGYFVEYAGSVFKNMSMEGRMTVCNLSIEMGARGGMIAPDDKTFDYIEGREYAPKGDEWTKAVNYWKTLKTDKDAIFDKEYNFKADEIEPMITGIDHNNRGFENDEIKFPTNCPECGTKLVKLDSEANFYCTNTKRCRPQVIGKIQHFVSRKAMNIDGLGDETIKLLYNKGYLKDISDIYNLDYNSISLIEGHADKSVDNLKMGIENSKSKPFQKVLYGLGIRYVGESASRKILKKIKSIEELMLTDLESLSKIDEIGEKTAASISEFFKDENNRKLIDKLKSAGLVFIDDNKDNTSSSLSNLTFVISGVFETYSRDEIKNLIEINGGKISSSVSSNTNYLVAGNNLGPAKSAKANNLGVPIINEKSFIDLIS